MKRRTHQYKIGLASGHHEKPVWVRGPVADASQKETPMLSTSYWKAHFSEALANGGIREFSLGMNASWTGKPETKDYMDDPELYQLYVDYAKWMREHRSLLTHRESGARVGVVYSLPSLMFRQYQILGQGDGGRIGKFYDVARKLEDEHVPYDAIIFGHPEIWDDTPTFERMKKQYDMIVLPGVDAMSDDQIELLDELAKDNIVILADAEVIYDENMNKREAPAKLEAISLKDEKLTKYGRRASLVEVDAPDDVTVNVWKSCNGKSFDVHLLNYQVNVRAETIAPASSILVRATLPKSFKVERCVLSQYGQPDQTLAFNRQGEWIEVTVPSLDAYAIVSFTDRDSIEKTKQAAEIRRAQDREYVKRIAHQLNLY
jgi:hypothetical protein